MRRGMVLVAKVLSLGGPADRAGGQRQGERDLERDDHSGMVRAPGAGPRMVDSARSACAGAPDVASGRAWIVESTI